MFRLGVFSDEVSQDLEVAVKMAEEYQLDALEIRSVWDKAPQDLNNLEDIARIKEVLEPTGLTVCAIASPFFKCDIGDAGQYAEHLKILRDCIELGRELGRNARATVQEKFLMTRILSDYLDLLNDLIA